MGVTPLSPSAGAPWPRTLVLATACIVSALFASAVTYLASQVGPSAWGEAMAGGDAASSVTSALQALTSSRQGTGGPPPTCGTSIPVAAGADAAAPGCLAEGAGFAVHGSGAQACVVGEFCSFTLSIWPPATWHVRGRIPLEWDLMVTLEGPALVHAYIEASRTSQTPLTPSPAGATAPARTFLVTYRAWDAGVYRAVVSNPCFTLILPGVKPAAYHNNSRIFQVAAWALSVQPRQQVGAGGAPGAGGVKRLLGGLLGKGGLAPKGLAPLGPSPCTETLQARWKAVAKPSNPTTSANRQPNASSTAGGSGASGSGTKSTDSGGEYRWEPYECAKWVPQSEVLARLAAKGVKEVAFIGDSHLRFLLLHSVYLLTGKVYPGLLRAHVNFTLPVPIPPPPHHPTEAPGTGTQVRRLQESKNASAASVPGAGGAANATDGGGARAANETTGEGAKGETRQTAVLFSFYWVDGVFKNGEFGCGTRGTYSHRYNDFAPINTKPDVAILDSGAWSAFRCKQPALAYSAHLNEFLSFMYGQLRAKNCSKMFFYGATPSPTCRPNEDAATNSLLKFEGDLARVLSGHYGVKYFNTWEVVAPKYEESCNLADPHYSCATVNNPLLHAYQQRVTGLHGEVGKALATTFLQFLVSSLG